jgi:hypothetical protein
MITARAVAQGSCLLIDCAGSWEHDPRGTRCGYLLHDTIRRGMAEATTAISEIVIDLTKVSYLGGDGPGWSVLGKATRGVKITYLAGEHGGRCLRELFAVTRLDQFIEVVVVDDV